MEKLGKALLELQRAVRDGVIREANELIASLTQLGYKPSPEISTAIERGASVLFDPDSEHPIKIIEEQAVADEQTESPYEAAQRLTHALQDGIFEAEDLRRVFEETGFEVAEEDLQRVHGRGDLVFLNAEGQVRLVGGPEDVPIGIAIGGNLVRVGRIGHTDFTPEEFERARQMIRVGGFAECVEEAAARGAREPERECARVWQERVMATRAREHAISYAAYASVYRGSVAYAHQGGRDFWRPIEHRYQFSRFPAIVEAKAWQLLKKYMSADQHFAFMEGTRIELINGKGDHRLLLHRNGDFSILAGARGAGIEMASGRIRSYKYPLGDEIAAFLDWFKHKTEELIANWHCGTYGIKREGR